MSQEQISDGIALIPLATVSVAGGAISIGPAG
jgi:hypothetical protein